MKTSINFRLRQRTGQHVQGDRVPRPVVLAVPSGPHGPIGYTKVCKCCGEVVAADAIAVRGAKVGDDVVIVTDDDLRLLLPCRLPEIAVQQFIDASEVGPHHVEGHYFVAPGEEPPSRATPCCVTSWSRRTVSPW